MTQSPECRPGLENGHAFGPLPGTRADHRPLPLEEPRGDQRDTIVSFRAPVRPAVHGGPRLSISITLSRDAANNPGLLDQPSSLQTGPSGAIPETPPVQVLHSLYDVVRDPLRDSDPVPPLRRVARHHHGADGSRQVSPAEANKVGGPSELFSYNIPKRYPLVTMSGNEGVHSVEATQQLSPHEESVRAVPHEDFQIFPGKPRTP